MRCQKCENPSERSRSSFYLFASGSQVTADVTSHDDTQRYVKTTVESYGRIDIYLANAVKDVSGAKQMQKLTYFWLIAIICFWQAELSAAADLPSLRPLAPDYARSMKSQNANTQTTVNFVNRSDAPADVYWEHYDRGVVFYQHLPSPDSCRVQPHVTHPCDVYDENVPSHRL